MPIVVLIIGVMLVITGLNNRLTAPANPNLVTLIQSDIAPTDGSVSFGVWLLAIIFVGFLGYVKDFKMISNGFLILLFLGIFLAGPQGKAQGSGFFSNLLAAFKNTGINPSSTTSSASPNTAASVTSFLSAGNSVVSGAESLLSSF